MATESGAKPPPPPPPPPPSAPATPGVVGSNSGRFSRFQSSRAYKIGQTGWAWRRVILFGMGTTYALVRWQSSKAKARKRDLIKDKTYLYWKIYDGGIVEAKSYGSNLNYLLNSSQTGSPEEPPRVMTLFDVVRTIKFIEQDDRVHGLVADFSNISVPSVPSYNLGLAQLEEIQDALLELRKTKHERLGKDEWRTVAWTDTFTSQGQYLFASAFDEIYTQPTGEVPLVGMGSTIPFYGRLAKWLGIDVHAEARDEYKSFVQPFIDEQLTPPQKANQLELINDLNDNLMTYIARNRYPTLLGLSGLNHVKALSQNGPYTASEAVKQGLLNGTAYRQDILDSVLDDEVGGNEEREIKGFYHYAKVMERAVEKTVKDVMDIGVVYLMGTIGDPGEFGTAAVVRGLKEAGEDENIGAVVLRIDSGGGGVVESDTIWGAVRDLREKYGKTVVASFGNASASGGYLVSTHADAILAAPSTVTGSIGVASLRPTFLTSFFDRLHITLDSLFTGSRSQDVTHKLTGAELDRYRAHVDEMYADFKGRVVEGRGIHPELIDLIAGGRVYAGIKAFELNAPKELIATIKGLEVEELPEEVRRVEQTKKDEIVLGSPDEESTSLGETNTSPSAANKAAIVVLPEDQDTSPFAPPQPATHDDEPRPLPISPSSPSDVASLDPAELNAQQALSTPETSQTGSSKVGASSAAGIYEIAPGPFGRGLIDGIGGIRDAAIYACELFISNGIAGYKMDNPGLSDQEALKALLPEADPGVDPTTGEMTMQMDVRLKRFPVQKGFWAQLKDASERGDSMEVQALPAMVKGMVVRWVLGVVADGLSDELHELGISSRALGTSGLGLGRPAGWRAVRAEWGGLNLR